MPHLQVIRSAVYAEYAISDDLRMSNTLCTKPNNFHVHRFHFLIIEEARRLDSTWNQAFELPPTCANTTFNKSQNDACRWWKPKREWRIAAIRISLWSWYVLAWIRDHIQTWFRQWLYMKLERDEVILLDVFMTCSLSVNCYHRHRWRSWLVNLKK